MHSIQYGLYFVKTTTTTTTTKKKEKKKKKEKQKTDITMTCNAPVICNHCLSPTGMGGDSGANVRGSDILSSPAVLGKCQSYAVAQINPRGNYYYKEWGYDCQEVPVVQSF